MSDPAEVPANPKPRRDRIELAVDRRPWERQPDEKPLAFESFSAYRGLGAGRTLKEAARQTQRNAKTIQTWSHQYRWEDRASAWDRQLDRERQEEQRTAIQNANGEITDLAAHLIHQLAADIRGWTDEKYQAMTVWEKAKLFQVAFNVFRLSSGQSTANVDVHIDQEKARLLVAVITKVIDSPELGLDADSRQLAYRMLTSQMRALEAGEEAAPAGG